MQANNRGRDRRIAGVPEKTFSFFDVSTKRRGVIFHPLRCLILMVAGIWVCFAGPLASAQTPSLLVSNLAQTSDSPQVAGDRLTARDDYVLGMVFETGPSEAGWLPSAVTLDVDRWPRGTTPIVSLYRAGLQGDGILPVPTTKITTLENPRRGTGSRRFTVPKRVRLESDTSYAIVVKSTATTAEGAFELRGAQRVARPTRVGANDAGTSGKRVDARCRPESAALWVAPRRPPASTWAMEPPPAPTERTSTLGMPSMSNSVSIA